MARKTNLEYAEEQLAKARADYEAFKTTPEYAEALRYRADKEAAQVATNAAERKESEAFRTAAVRLGLFEEPGDRGWSKKFLADVSKAFNGMTTATQVTREGRRRKDHPFYDVVSRIGRSIVAQDTEFQAVHAELETARKHVVPFVPAERLLRDREYAVQHAQRLLAEEQDKHDAYIDRRDARKAEREALQRDAEYRETVEQEKAREEKVKEFLRTGKVPEEIANAYGVKEA